MSCGVPNIDAKCSWEGIADRLKQLITEVCQEHQAELLQLEIMPDHVHLLVDCDPTIRHSSACTSRERPLIPVFTTRVPHLEAQIADIVDQILFCLDGWGSTALCHEALY